MTTLRSHIGEKGITTREKALKRFYESMRVANANRRLDPEKFVTVKKVVRCRSGAFDIYYTVPSRYRKKV